MAIERQGGALDMRPTLFRYKEQKMERIRKAAKATSVIAIAILTALVVTALCSPEEDWTELAEMVESLDGQSDLERQIDWDNLPKEVVAWVEVPGTSIDEPIVQASPNSPDAYLYKDVFGEGAYGTPYIDCECSIDSRFVMVYGHHMSDGSVFAGFASFIDEGYAQEHDEIIVYKRSGEILNLKPIAVNIVSASQESLVIDQETEVASLLKSVDLKLAEASSDGQLFAFATCSYQTWNSRTVVYACTSSVAR